MRMLLDRFDIFHAQPDANSSQLSDRSPDEAYLTSVPGKQYAVYFPVNGLVVLDLGDSKGSIQLTWLDIASSRWIKTEQISKNGKIQLKTPEQGHWVALLEVGK